MKQFAYDPIGNLLSKFDAGNYTYRWRVRHRQGDPPRYAQVGGNLDEARPLLADVGTCPAAPAWRTVAHRFRSRRWQQASPNRSASHERRRTLGSESQGEAAALSIVVFEVCARGCCDLAVDARVGVSRTTR